MKKTAYRYYGSTGKEVTRDAVIAALTAGLRCKIEKGIGELTIRKDEDGLFFSKCPDKDHNASCLTKTPQRAVEWAEGHLRQAH